MGVQSRILAGAAPACALALFVSVAALSGCDSGPSALPARDHSASAMAAATRAAEDRPARRADRAEADTPLVDGKPMWSSNRKYTAQENADYHFKRSGADFGAASVEDYVVKAHAFVDHPPKGALTLKRANGDRLIYDPKANVFAVASKDGAPRTMFKPEDGMTYWETQKAKEAKVASSRSKKDDDA